MRKFVRSNDVRLGLLVVIAAAWLNFVAVAQAAPPDPVTLGGTTLSNIRLNGVPGTQLVVAPGANVTITADWSDHTTGCPGCIDNLPVAFQGFGAQPAGCIELLRRAGQSGTGTVALGAVPTTPGTYNIVGNFEQTFFCGQFWKVPNAFPVIAQVVVLPNKKAQCKKGAWRNFAGMFKNQGDCVSYVATKGKNPPSGATAKPGHRGDSPPAHGHKPQSRKTSTS